MSEILEGDYVGVVLHEFSQESLTDGMIELVKIVNSFDIKIRFMGAIKLSSLLQLILL